MASPTAGARYFRVKNLDKYQHYRDRNPPWIKLHQSVTEDTAFALLPDAAKSHLMLIWLLASRADNRLPFDAVFIGARINAREAVDLNLLMDRGFLVLETLARRKRDASKTLSKVGRPNRDIEQRTERENGEQRTPPPPANDAGATETRPAFGVLLDEATCPACRNRGTIRRASGGRGYFCGDKLGGCGQTYDLLEPSIMNQLTPRARKAIEDRVDAGVAATGPRPAPPPPDPAIAAAEEDAWNRLPVLVDEFLAWYADNPEAGETLGRRGYHGQAFGGWPGGRDIPPGPKDAVLKAALKKLKAPEGARRAG